MAAYFTEDAVYHNIPLDAVVGREAIAAFITGSVAAFDGIDFDIHRQIADGHLGGAGKAAWGSSQFGERPVRVQRFAAVFADRGRALCRGDHRPVSRDCAAVVSDLGVGSHGVGGHTFQRRIT